MCNVLFLYLGPKSMVSDAFYYLSVANLPNLAYYTRVLEQIAYYLR